MNLDQSALLQRYARNDPGKWKTSGFARFPISALYDERLDKAAIAVLLVLTARTFHGKKVSFPSLATIAKEARYSRPSVIKAIRTLEKFEYLTVERASNQTRKTNRYTLVDRG
ncbi:MAG: hypothetical protein HGB37_01580 [Candidatus Moranbacteria bacterium]|nr:hypothetical protein [Candidatus Moranbacteria bacterium]